MADVDLNIGGNTKQLEADIKKTVGKAYSIDLKTSGSQPLGRITSKVSEFNKSLEASNARVIAFGASAGVIFGLETAFRKLVSASIEVQKSLADINVILNVSTEDLQKFGDSLFNIARNTGQSFNEVATAATEFSRQGLGVEETLKRTNEALILSRLSGLDAAKSVEALTAAVNSFASQAVTATEIVNKFANVDAAFAVSSGDLAEAISRVGSSAAQSGVNLDELISIVTSAQQTTARGGSVIGNSFKTIFTRLQRGDVVDLLSSLGVETLGANGELKSTIELLRDLATVYDQLGTLDQAAVAEKVGGVFQINILKAALADLGKEYSIYDRALKISQTSTDEAIQRNEQLNKTYSAQLNVLKENITQLAASAGTKLIGPSFDRVIGGANEILGGVNTSDGKGIGAALANGILDGIGQVLSGPGLALLGGVLIKLFKDFTVYAGGSVKELLGLNNASKQQAEIQRSINGLLSQNPSLLKLMQQGTNGLNQAATILLNSFKQQTIELQKQDALTAKIASQLYGGGVRIQGGIPTATNKTKTKAEGYIPAFAKESRDVKRGVGGAKSSDKPIGPFTINGEPTIINSGEKLIPNFGGSGETAILTRDMQKSMSMAMGYIPNFAVSSGAELYNLKRKTKRTPIEEARYQQLLKEKGISKTEDQASRREPIDLGGTERLSLIYGKQTTSYKKIDAAWKDKDGQFGARGQVYKGRFNATGFNPKEAIKPEDQDLTTGLADYIVDYTNRYTSFFGNKSSLARIKDASELSNLGSLPSIAGTVFETAVTKGTNSVLAQSSREGGASAVIDFISPNSELRSLFNNAPGDYEAKISESLAPDVIRKGLKENIFKIPKAKPDSAKTGKVQTKARGYIPNFANPNLIQEVSKRANLLNSNITNKLKEGSGLKDEAYIKAAQKLGVNVVGLDKFMTPMSFPLKGKDKVLNLSKALGTGFGRSFSIDALKMGDWNYVKPQFESAGYTKEDFSKLSKFAATQKGYNALRWWKSRASGYIPNFAKVEKGKLPMGVRGRTYFGGQGSKNRIELGSGATEDTLAHEVFHSAYSKSTFKNAASNPSIGKFISAPGKYAGGAGVISDAIFKGVNRKNLYSGLGLNSVQLDFEGKNPGASYSGSKAIDEIITRVQEKVFNRKGDLDSLSIDEKNFVKNAEKQGLISGKRFSNIARRSKEGSKFRNLIGNKFSSTMGQFSSGFIPNFAGRFGPKVSKAFYSQSATPWDRGIPMTPEFDSKTGAIRFPSFETNKNKPGRIAHSEGVAGQNLFSINQFQELLEQQKFNPRFWSRRSYEFIPDVSGKISKKSKGFIPNFANRKVGYLDGDVLSDPRYTSIVEEQIQKLGLKGGTAEYHKYLGDLAKKARKTGSIKKFTGIFGVPGAGKSTMMLGGKSAQKADNAKARQTERIPIIRPEDIGRVDEIIDTRASLVGTTKALEGGYWSGLDRLMIMSSSTPEEQKEIKKRRDLRDSQILQGKSDTAFGRSVGTSQGAALDSGYIEAMALSVLGPNKTRVMGINENFKLRRKKGEELPLVEKKQIGLSYGAFSPSTRGHLEMMEMAKKQGISPEDFIVAVSKEGGKIDPKDPHSFRTAIFDQKTRKYLAKKTFTGANVISANSDLFTGGTIPKMLEVDPVGKRRRFLSAKSGSMAFVGSDKQEKDLQKYKDAGYKINVGERTEGISGTDARAAILAGDSKLIAKIFADHVVSTINQIGPNIKNRADVFPEILSRINSKLDKRLDPILAELSTLPSRITKTTPEEVAVKIQGLREQRDKYQKLKQYLPTKFLKKLGGIFPQKYGIPTAAEGYIPNFANALDNSISRELDQSGLPKSQIYVKQKDALVSNTNPAGLGVFNKRDEGSTYLENKAIKKRSKGFIPNFAEPSATSVNDIPDLSSSFAALGTELSSLALMLSLNRNQYKDSLTEMVKANRKAAREQLKSGQITKETFDKIKKVSGFTKFKAGVSANAGSLSFLAPIIAETISNSIPSETKGQRTAKAGVSALGQTASFAGTGFLVAGAPGAAVGAAAGALLGLVNVIKEASTNMPELNAAVQKAGSSLSATTESNSRLLQSYEAYNDALKSGNPKTIQSTQNAYQKELSLASEEQRNALASSRSLAEAQLKLAEVAEKQARKLEEAELNKTLEGQKLVNTYTTANPMSPSATSTNYINPTSFNLFKSTLVDQINKSTNDIEIKKNLFEKIQKRIEEEQGKLGNRGSSYQPKVISGLIESIEKEIGVTLPDALKNPIIESREASAAFKLLTEALKELDKITKESASAVNSFGNITRSAIELLNKKIADLLSKMMADIDATLSVGVSAVKSRGSLSTNARESKREANIQEIISGPRTISESITGPDSITTLSLGLSEAIAKAQSLAQKETDVTFNTSTDNITNTIATALRGQLENLQSTLEGSVKDGGVLSDNEELIKNQMTVIGGVSNDLPSIVESVMGSFVGSFKPGQDLPAQDIANSLRKELSDRGLSSPVIDSLMPSILGNLQDTIGILEGIDQNTAAQIDVLKTQFKDALTSKEINSSLKAFGGINEYIDNKPAENPLLENNPKLPLGGFSAQIQENLSPLTRALEGSGKILSNLAFKYNNPESIKARKDFMPDLGRESLRTINFLKERTGGLYEPSPNSKLIGFAEAGRTETIKKEIDALKKTRDLNKTANPEFAKEIDAAIQKLVKVGPERIAKLQVAQATGALTMKDAKDIYTDTSTRSNDKLIEILPRLSKDLESVSYTGDTGEQAAMALNVIQVNALKELQALNQNFVKIGQMNSIEDTANNIKTPTVDIPSLTNINANIPSIKGGMTLDSSGMPNIENIPITTPSKEDVDFSKNITSVINQMENFGTDKSTPVLDSLLPPMQAQIGQMATTNNALVASINSLNTSIQSLNLTPTEAGTSKPSDVISGPEVVRNQDGTLNTVNFNVGGININSSNQNKVLEDFDNKMSNLRSELMNLIGEPQPPRVK